MKLKNALTKTMLRATLLAGKAAGVGGIPILTYHSIDREGGPTSIAPEIFERQMAALSASGYESITLGHLGNMENGGRRRAVAITFDDGYDNLYTEALPALERYGLTATVFVATDYVGGSNEWEPEPGVPRLKHLSWEQIGGLSAAGIEIGAHTMSHPDLTALSPQEARSEIEGCKLKLEEFLGRDVKSFCYPYGAVSEPVRDMVARAGYSFACTLTSGMGRPDREPLMLSRFGMSRISTGDPAVAELYLMNCLRGSAPAYTAARNALRKMLPGTPRKRKN